MDATPFLIALGCILAAFTIPTLFQFARTIGEPADDEHSDFTEPHRTCGPWCCRGGE